MLRLAVGFVVAVACGAQNWEMGGGIGYGWYHNGSIISAGGTAAAGIRNRFTATGVVTENLYDRLSGEVRYVYHDGDSFLQNGTAKGTVQAQSHSFTYDVLFHLQPREARIRLFVAGGVGAKYYETTGPSPNPQPLPRIAGLAESSQWKPLFDFGGGVKVNLSRRVVVRGDVRDYLTTFPDRLFSPVGGATSRGIFHQFTPMVGVGYRF